MISPIDTPQDQGLREYFTSDVGTNFSVKSSAGSGKTTAIASRVASIAGRPGAVKMLPDLVVVTFTQKAADELQDRARSAILMEKPAPAVLHALSRGFFGTIHAFAVSLLRSYGHYLGIPAVFDVVMDDTRLWRQFLQQHNGRPSRMNAVVFDRLASIVPVSKFLPLVRDYNFRAEPPQPVGAFPDLEIGEVTSFSLPKRADTAANIRAAQADFKEWLQKLEQASAGLNPVPAPTLGGKEFLATCGRVLEPLHDWVARATAEAVHDLALEYRDFRVKQGQLTFNDQVSLAAGLFRHGRAAREIRARGFRIILDEAQDTDPHQFELLVEAARPVTAGKVSFLHSLRDGPRPGHFCMVGDPQQSIYGERADLAHYQAVHQALLSTGSAKELKFQVTFRCDEKIVGFSNRVFPPVLNSRNDQVEYVPLIARPRAGPGQVIRLPVDVAGDDSIDPGLHMARQLGRWLQSTGLEALHATQWGEVALLCPRVDWFGALRTGLHAAGLQVQFLSSRSIRGDSPAFAWMTALCTIFSEPRNSAEIFGVLRETFAHSDHDIAVFVRRRTERLNLVDSPALQEIDPVAATLRLLADARELFRQLPLREALGQACTKVQLRDRLLALPADQYPGLAEELESLLLRASHAESVGETLDVFTRSLRVDFDERVESGTLNPDALPVITNLKAKGLQWPCVVLPYFSREISYHSSPFPRFLPAACPRPLAFSSKEIPEAWVGRIAGARQREIERLLYVSMTRAKHTLVLLDDTAQWGGNDGPAAFSLAAALQCSSTNKDVWTGLPTAAAADESKVPTPVTKRPEREPQPGYDPAKLARRAVDFPRRILPHALASTYVAGRRVEDPEQRSTVAHDLLRPQADQAQAVGYGVWWHDLMQMIPWGAKDVLADANSVFRDALVFGPAPERARLEWKLFLASELWARLNAPDTRVFTEFPFMAPLKGGDAIEGVMDIVAHHPAKKQWEIAEWKTHHGVTLEVIVDSYRAQLRAYVDSLGAIVGEPVRGTFYSTALGKEASLT
jgi:ATP-dependent exoDNAse (exonuclease V) beta subunit